MNGAKILLLGLVMAFVAGCATSMPKSLNLQALPQIKEGITTRAEVEQLLGKPYQEFKSDHGLTLYYASLNQHGNEISDAIGVIAPLPSIVYQEAAGEARFIRDSIMILINDRNLVAKVTTWRSDYTAKGGLFTKEIGHQIDPVKLAQIQPATTTQSQVEAMLGSPQDIITTSDRTELRYTCNTFSKDQTYAIIFGPDHKVRDVEEFTMVGTHFLGAQEKERLPQIQAGHTTRSEVEKLLGKPCSVGKGRLGSSLHYVVSIKGQYSSIQIEFGLDDKVTKVSEDYVP